MKRNQKGFTLIELVASIAVGATVSTAAISLYIASQKNYHLQDNMAVNQVIADKGVDFVAGQIKKANYGLQYKAMGLHKPGAGIINSATNYDYNYTVSNSLISQHQSGPSYMTVGSDQLVIKYLPAISSGRDCEGGAITSTSTPIIERYFVRVSDDSKTLSLACDAGRMVGGVIQNMGGAGQEIIPYIDHFNVVYTVSNNQSGGAERLRDVSISQYKTLTGDYSIVGVKIGVITRSASGVGNNYVNLANSVRMLNQDLSFNESVKNSRLRFMHTYSIRAISLKDGSTKMEL